MIKMFIYEVITSVIRSKSIHSITQLNNNNNDIDKKRKVIASGMQVPAEAAAGL